jgi:ribosomal protein S18 acetylase RimI-like enzyme
MNKSDESLHPPTYTELNRIWRKAEIIANLHCIPMSLEHHAPQTVAQLIYDSAPDLFELLFGRTAIPVIHEFVIRSHNRFSHRYVQVAQIEDQVVGIATLIPALELQDNTDQDSVLNRWAKLRRQMAYWLILDRVLEQNYPSDSFYIANLAVQSAYRGQGIGTQLLQHCLASAALAEANRVFISVDINNPKAQKLYESLGFEVVKTKTLALLNVRIGSRVLARST